MAGKKRSSRRWTRLIGGLLGLGIVWGFYVSRTSDKEIGAASLHEAKRLFEYTELLPSGEGEIVRHTYYTLSFNSRHKQANWVYYTLEWEGKERVAERTDRFREDLRSLPITSKVDTIADIYAPLPIWLILLRRWRKPF